MQEVTGVGGFFTKSKNAKNYLPGTKTLGLEFSDRPDGKKIEQEPINKKL